VADVVRAPDLSWFSEEVQNDLLAAGASGMKVRWVALYCGVAPKALENILDMGQRRDADPKLRSFFRRWMDGRTRLMFSLHERWVAGDLGAHVLLCALFPEAYGKDAQPDWQPFQTQSSADDLEQLRAIIDNPAAFGDEVYQMFQAAGRLRADGT
jgi:hypothetical protein